MTHGGTPGVMAPSPARISRRAEIIAVVGGKGGVGKTHLACNLAAALAADPTRSVALIDLDLQFGDVATYSGLSRGGPGIARLCSVQTSDWDDDFVLGNLVELPWGVRAMVSPDSPELADLVDEEERGHVSGLYTALRPLFDWVVVDLGRHLDTVHIVGLERADRVIAVTDSDLASLKDLGLVLRVCGALRMDLSRWRVVAVHGAPQAELTSVAIQARFQVPVAGALPHDARAVRASAMRGRPLVVDSPDGRIGRAIRGLLPLVTGVGAPPVSVRRGVLSRTLPRLLGGGRDAAGRPALCPGGIRLVTDPRPGAGGGH